MCALRSCRTRNRSSYNGTSRHNKVTLLPLCLQAGHKFLNFQAPRWNNPPVFLPHRHFSRCFGFSEYFHFVSGFWKFTWHVIRSLILCGVACDYRSYWNRCTRSIYCSMLEHAGTKLLIFPLIMCGNGCNVSLLLQAQLHILQQQQQQNLQNPMLGGSQNTSMQRQTSLGLVTSPQSPSPSSTPTPTNQSQGLSASSPQQLTQVSLSSATSPTEHGSYHLCLFNFGKLLAFTQE